MRRCDNDLGCPGHGEKFDHCIIEALYYSDPDEDTGSTEAHGYYGIYFLDEDETLPVDDDHNVVVPSGTYLLMTDDQGYVYDIDGNNDQLNVYFKNASDQYHQWCEKNMEYV